MKRRISFIVALGLAGALAHAATSPNLTVAVYDFTYPKKEPGGYGDSVTTLVTADLAGETNLVLVERSELSKALNEQSLGASGMVNSDMAAKIGQLTGAKILVAGQVIRAPGDHLVIVADLIGTETGRLFADTVEGPANNLVELTSTLSRKIAQTINDHAPSLALPAEASRAEQLKQIVKSIAGTNRPTLSIHITQWNRVGRQWRNGAAENEFGIILLQAGFKIVDEHSETKPDLILSGDITTNRGEPGTRHGGLLSIAASLELKVQERKTGNILALEREENTATGAGLTVVERLAEDNTIDALAARILPLLAK